MKDHPPRIRRCSAIALAQSSALRPGDAGMRKFANDYLVYLLLMAFLASIKLSIDYLFVAQFRAVSQALVFDWKFIGIWTVAGLAGIWLSHRTGFPSMMDASVSHLHRF